MQMKWRDYNDFMTKYHPMEHMDECMPYTIWSFYWDMMGVLLREGLIDMNIVVNILPSLFYYWKKFEPFIREYREKENYPYLTGMEYLYNEYSKIMGADPGERARWLKQMGIE